MLTYGYQNVNKDNNVHSLKCGNILLQKYSERMCIYKTQSGRTLRKQHAPGCLFFNQSVELPLLYKKPLKSSLFSINCNYLSHIRHSFDQCSFYVFWVQLQTLIVVSLYLKANIVGVKIVFDISAT
jgi:hypothetical protein